MLCIRGPIIDYKDKVFFTPNKGVKYIDVVVIYFQSMSKSGIWLKSHFYSIISDWTVCDGVIVFGPSEYIKSGIPKLLLFKTGLVDNMQLEPGNKKKFIRFHLLLSKR